MELISNDFRIGDGTFYANLLLAAVAQLGYDKLLGVVEAFGKGDLHIVFQIEGHDVSFKEIVDEWEKQVDSEITARAKKLVGDKFVSLFDTLTIIEEDIKSIL